MSPWLCRLGLQLSLRLLIDGRAALVGFPVSGGRAMDMGTAGAMYSAARDAEMPLSMCRTAPLELFTTNAATELWLNSATIGHLVAGGLLYPPVFLLKTRKRSACNSGADFPVGQSDSEVAHRATSGQDASSSGVAEDVASLLQIWNDEGQA